jgi:hypothetical protein
MKKFFIILMMILLAIPIFAQTEKVPITFSYDDWQVLSNSIKSLKENKILQGQLLLAAKDDINKINISLELTLDEVRMLNLEIEAAKKDNTDLKQHLDVAVKAQEHLKKQIDMVLERLQDRDMELYYLYQDLDEAEEKAFNLEKLNAQLQAEAKRQWASGIVYTAGGIAGGTMFIMGINDLASGDETRLNRGIGLTVAAPVVTAGVFVINYYIFHRLLHWW